MAIPSPNVRIFCTVLIMSIQLYLFIAMQKNSNFSITCKKIKTVFGL